MKHEFELIQAIKKKFPRSMLGDIGIGDDADSLGPGTLFAADTIVEGVDFVFGKISPEEAGHKALAINLSDIAAMGGDPRAFLISLGIPKKINDQWVSRFYDGVIQLASKYRLKCLGGDITGSQEFFASITIMGQIPKGRPILRRGAQEGDWIGVTGSLGGSILGKHCSFQPRINTGRFMQRDRFANAMIDVSDGLIQDLEHILKSSGRGAAIHLDRIPISEAAYRAAKRDGRSVLEHALTDGEDFELLFTVSNRKKSKLEASWKKNIKTPHMTWIGRVTRNRGKIEWFLNGKRTDLPFERKGFQHF